MFSTVNTFFRNFAALAAVTVLMACSNTPAEQAALQVDIREALTQACRADALLQPFVLAGTEFILDASGQAAISGIIGSIADVAHVRVLQACAALAAQNAVGVVAPPVP